MNTTDVFQAFNSFFPINNIKDCHEENKYNTQITHA